MSKQIGFVVLSHAYPLQLARLVRTLRRVYDNPPIVCHHDFTQTPLSRGDFPPEVQFVSPHVETSWGRFSVVEASLRALELLYRNATPDWFMLLSGSDYPTMRGDSVVDDLFSGESDALLDFREVPRALSNEPILPPDNPALQHFVSPGNQKVVWGRYVGFNAWVPIVRHGPRIGRYTMNLPIDVWQFRFRPQFKCFYGDHWFAGNQKVAQILLRPTEEHLLLRRHLRWRVVPEECYYHTVLGNFPSLKINKATRRFSQWLGGGAHPQNLEFKDLPSVYLSRAHFARKFMPEAPVLDEIDRVLFDAPYS